MNILSKLATSTSYRSHMSLKLTDIVCRDYEAKERV